jgi:hypothetical protein
MKFLVTFTLLAAASLCWGQAARTPIPPVLRPLEPPESGTLVLPGEKTLPASKPPNPVPAAPKPLAAAPRPAARVAGTVIPPRKFAAPALPEAPQVVSVVTAPSLPQTLRATSAPALPGPEDRTPPPGFDADSALFLQNRIGQWGIADARTVLGNPLRQRAALDDNGSENGRIYAFQDPTSLFKELELDFDGQNGKLRTVFVYPWSMSWQECRRQFGANVSATQANKGRTFYSYVNRRLDVLVAPGGQVISLGLY